jgi:hypothetical protein
MPSWDSGYHECCNYDLDRREVTSLNAKESPGPKPKRKKQSQLQQPFCHVFSFRDPTIE